MAYIESLKCIIKCLYQLVFKSGQFLVEKFVELLLILRFRALGAILPLPTCTRVKSRLMYISCLQDPGVSRNQTWTRTCLSNTNMIIKYEHVYREHVRRIRTCFTKTRIRTRTLPAWSIHVCVREACLCSTNKNVSNNKKPYP